MKTTRRTILKGSVAFAAAVAAPAFFRSGRVSAQAPQYELIDLVTFTEHSGDSYNLFDVGGFWDVAEDGTIAGTDVVDGRMVPVIWSPDGERTLLDTSGLEYESVNNLKINDSGTIVAHLVRQGSEDTYHFGVIWRDGSLSQIEPADSTDVIVRDLNAAGQMCGQVDPSPARWTDSGLELVPLATPSGFGYGEVINSSGDVGGYIWTNETTPREQLFVWATDGSMEHLSYPADLLESLDPEHFYMSIVDLSDTRNLIVNYGTGSGDERRSGSISYRGKLPLYVQGLTDGNLSISTANNAGLMIGSSQGNEDSTRTIWVDDIPYALDDVTVNQTGLELAWASAMNEAGTAVGLAIGPDKLFHGVVLRPVS